jgi:carbon monoxide dehydrogenase subunit G
MQIENHFTVPAEPDAAWAILLDVPRIAPCMPGAELSEAVDDRHFKGNAKLRVGPVALSFAGEAEIVEIDEAARTATVRGRGSDTKGRGGAEATVRFRLSAGEDGGSRVDITTDLDLSGSIAQYGRASGLIDAIAGQLVSDFANNLAAEIGADAAPAGGDGPADEAPAAEAAPAASAAPAADNSISGISLFFRALWSMIRGLFGGKR